MPKRSETVKLKTPVSPPDVVSFVLSLVISIALSVGLSLMFQSTYELELNLWILLTALPLYAVLATIVNSRKHIGYALALLGMNVIACGVFYYFDIAGTQTGFWHIYTVLKQCTFRDLPVFRSVLLTKPENDTMVFLLMGMWPAFFASFVILRRRSFWYAFACCFPYILFTIALDYMFPSMLSCELVIGSMILLVLFRVI